jgi:hypothetical protein
MGHKRAMNNIHDRSYKDLYSNKIVFLDLVKEMLKAPWAKDLKEENLVLVDKEYILSDYEENEADIVYRANINYNATRKWNAPRYFKDIVNENELFRDNIVNFKYELFDVNHQYTKEDLIKNNNITSAIFLLDQKVEALEFFERLKAVALKFNKLTSREKEILKHWLRNTVDETIRENVV